MENIKELLEKKGYRRRKGNWYVEYSKSFYDCNGKEVFIISFSEYGEDSWIIFYSNDLFTIHGIVTATPNLKTYEEIKREYDKFCSIPLFLINHEFYLSETSSLIWKGEFGTEIKLKETPSSDAKYSCTINSFGNVKKIGCVSTLDELDAMLGENDLDGIWA